MSASQSRSVHFPHQGYANGLAGTPGSDACSICTRILNCITISHEPCGLLASVSCQCVRRCACSSQYMALLSLAIPTVGPVSNLLPSGKTRLTLASPPLCLTRFHSVFITFLLFTPNIRTNIKHSSEVSEDSAGVCGLQCQDVSLVCEHAASLL